MAPITDTIVDELKSLVSKLESRVAELESKLGGEKGTPSSSGAMRMILMGPPGAGMLSIALRMSKGLFGRADIYEQARELKRHASRTNSASAIWCALYQHSR